MSGAASREQRRHEDEPLRPPRTDFQRDRDRILHTTALRRLASITQVVSAAEGHVFHNRLTHVLKVAQIARGLAEHLLWARGKELADQLGGLDADVAETAALSHDLGHPPFGHIAEQRLDALLKKHGLSDGFEGNAQSFRIVTKLAIRSGECDGLNLTRASLAALLKYPWFRQTGRGKKAHKWGAYRTEREDFKFARQTFTGPQADRRSLEAEVMDWADDIAYSVYDLEDFYRAGLIPLDRIFGGDSEDLTAEAEEFLSKALGRWKGLGESSREADYRRTLKGMSELLPFSKPYDGSKKLRGVLRGVTSTLIRRYIRAIDLNPAAVGRSEACVVRRESAEREVKLLKELTWQYVIVNPSLARIQYGQCAIIEHLFSVFMDAARSRGRCNLFPLAIQERLRETRGRGKEARDANARTVTDFISGLTEHQAIELYQRLTGSAAGSVLYSSV